LLRKLWMIGYKFRKIGFIWKIYLLVRILRQNWKKKMHYLKMLIN